MATSPLASLFITTGIRDAGSTAFLMKLKKNLGTTTTVAWGLVSALDAVNARLITMSAMSGSGNFAIAAAGMRQLRNEAMATNRVLSRQTAMGAGVGSGPRAQRAGGGGGGRGAVPMFGGGFGVAGAAGAFATIAGVTAGIRGVQTAAGLESASIRAAFAANEPGNRVTRRDVERFQRESLAISREFRRGVGPSAALIQEIQQLGVEHPETRKALARAGISMNVVEPDVSPDEAAAAIFRLIKSTTSSDEEFRRAGSAAIYYANALKIAGDESAAGVHPVFEMVKAFQPIAKLAGAGADEIIALSGALADLNEQQRELFRTALLRVTGKQFQDPASVGLIGQYIGGEKGAQFVKDAATDPFQALVVFVERLARASAEGENLGTILNQLGFRNVRDRVLLQTFVNSLDKYQSILGQIREESLGSTGTLRVMDATRMELESLAGAWAGVTTAVDRFTSVTISRLSPAIKSVLALLSGSVNAVTSNPLLAGLLLTAGAGAGVRGLRRGAQGQGVSQRFSSGLLNMLALIPWIGPRVTGRNPIANMRRGFSTRYGRGVTGAMDMNRALGPTTGQIAGRNAIRGAGLMSAFGMGGLGGKMLAGGAGRLALGAMGGPVGLGLMAITAFASLGPVFDSLGNMFAELGNRSGPVGTIFKLMATVFKTMELGAKGIGFVFQKIMDLFDNKAVRKVIDFFGKGFDFVNDKVLDPAIEFLDKKAGQGSDMPTAPGGLTGAAGTRIEVHNYSDGMGATQSIFDSLTYNAIPAGV